MRYKTYDLIQKMYDTIEDSDLEEFIIFAKKYNIFQPNGTKFYKDICNRIKARLDREGLSHETVRPE